MQNKVGDNAPSNEVMAQLVEHLAEVVETIRPFGTILSTEERKRLLHPRRDADPMVQRVHDLAVKHGVSIPQIPLDGMMRDKTLRGRMHPLVDLFRAGLVIAEDTEAQASSEMWEAYLAYYSVLSSMAGRLPQLTVELEPVIDFMARMKRTPKDPETKPA